MLSGFYFMNSGMAGLPSLTVTTETVGVLCPKLSNFICPDNPRASTFAKASLTFSLSDDLSDSPPFHTNEASIGRVIRISFYQFDFGTASMNLEAAASMTDTANRSINSALSLGPPRKGKERDWNTRPGVGENRIDRTPRNSLTAS